MTTPGEQQPEGRKSVVSLLAMTVTDTHMTWTLSHWERQGQRQVDSGAADLILNPRRRATISMLVDLLRHAEDGKRRDALSDDLHDDLFRVVGHELFDLLFWGKIRRRLAGELNSLSEEEISLLRITLAFEGHTETKDWLASLPWEYACTPVGGGHEDDDDLPPEGVFLAQRVELVLSRRLSVYNARRLGNAKWPVSVLLVGASPVRDPDDEKQRDLKPVNPTRIIEKLTELEGEGRIVLHKLVDEPPSHPAADFRWTATYPELKAAVREHRPVIVHFLGHGRNFRGAGHLAFSHDDGTVDWVRDSDFAKLVENCSSFKLAFMQACESGLPDPYVSFSGVARQLAVKGLPAVVAMQYRVRASTANAFAAAFYDALLVDELPIDHAVEKGRERILEHVDQNARMSFGLPVVYLNSPYTLTDPTASPPDKHRMPAFDRNDADAEMVCPRCRLDIEPTKKVCRECALRVRCGKCETPFKDPEKDNFCGECGEPLAQTPYEDDKIERAPGTVTGDATKPARATLKALQGEDVA